MDDRSSGPGIPADVRDAFEEAISVLIDWDSRGGAEPTVSLDDKPVPISKIAGLAEAFKDPMPSSVFWRMAAYANSFVTERRTEAVKLTKDGSFETGARCLLKWVRDNKKRFEQ